MTTERTNVVFIHGLWLHASSWDPWAELFRTAGYAPVAPGWPGVPGTVAGLALAEEKYGSGRFTLADLIAPALALAREGMAVTDDIADLRGNELERLDRKSTRLNSSHITRSRMPSSA